MSAFLYTKCCENVETKCLNGTLYNKEDNEVVTSRLESKIAKLEEDEKEFEALMEEYKQLENDISLLKEANLRLEYETKQKAENYNKTIEDLNSSNANYQEALNDKTCVNKKLLEENQCLQNELKSKNDEIADLTNKLNSVDNRFNSTEKDKDNLNNVVNDLTNLKATQKDKIEELVNDNKKLSKICQDQNNSLYLTSQEKAKLNQKLYNDDASINNLNCRVRINTNNLNKTKAQFDKSTELNMHLQKDLQDLEDEFKKLKLDNIDLKNELNKQVLLRKNEDKENDQMRIVLNDRKNKLKCLNVDYWYLKNNHMRKCDESNMYQMENDKLKQHMILLTEENDNLSCEIDNIIKDDNQMKNILNRSDKLSTMLKSNDGIISQMPPEIHNYRNCYEFNRTQMTPCFKNLRIELRQNNEKDKRRYFSPKSKYTYSRLEYNL